MPLTKVVVDLTTRWIDPCRKVVFPDCDDRHLSSDSECCLLSARMSSSFGSEDAISILDRLSFSIRRVVFAREAGRL